MDAAAQAKDALLQVVSFRLGDELYGVDILLVQEINRMVQVTRVPNAPAFVEGVMNLRGHVIPVVDLRKRLGLPERERRDQATRVVVVDLKGQRAGFIVDAVDKVLRIPASTVDPPPSLSASGTEQIRGVARLEGGPLLILLDFERILSPRERSDLKAVG